MKSLKLKNVRTKKHDLKFHIGINILPETKPKGFKPNVADYCSFETYKQDFYNLNKLSI